MRRTVLASFALWASACALSLPATDPAGQSPTATPRSSITASPTRTPALAPSSTPEPTATPTPRPTNTPFPRVAFSDQPAEISYQVPLTVQKLTPFEATIHFELDRPAPGWLLYRPVLDEEQGWWAIPLAEGETVYQMPLVGLTPGTRYAVQVGIGEALETLRAPRLFGAKWGPVRFAAPALGEPELRFGVVGDSGFGDDKTRALIELMDGYDLDFVLHTGDSVYKIYEESSPAEAFAKKYFSMFAPLLLQAPIFPVLGNHDFDLPALADGRPYFVRAFPALADPSVPSSALGTWYSFERSGIQFIMLDSAAFHGSGGRGEQTAWLEERLADPSFRFSIPVFHTPPYTSGLHRGDGNALRLDWSELFEAAGVPLVFSGHDHNYERIERDGLTYVVSGGGSPVLYRKTQPVGGSQQFNARMHFVLVEISDVRLSLTAIDLDGKVLDRAIIPTRPG
ncbi:MAG: metallophosphoesterase [Chloroflexi bacterium]|nr:metallophosphoesterase [Chloroflexota bacterium]